VIREHYQQRIEEYQRRLDAIEQKSDRLSRLRGLTFLVALVAAVVGWSSSQYSWIWYVGAGASFLGFVALAAFHEFVQEQALQIRMRQQMSKTQLDRMDRKWKRIPVVDVDVPQEHQAVAADLDLFGKASVFQLTSLAHTPFGTATLRDWLLNPASAEEITDRQQAVTTLAEDFEFREQLDLHGRMLGVNSTAPTDFVQWAEGEPWLAKRGWLRWLARLLAVSFIAALIVGIIGLMEPAVMFLAILGIVGLNTVILVLAAGRVNDIFNQVSSGNHDIQLYRELLESIAELPANCTFFTELQATMGATPREPLSRLKGLTRIVGFANLRRNGLLGIPYLVLQFVVLIDFHILCLLERWQRDHGQAVRPWLTAIGQVEAISSLATLAHDNPDWTFPVIVEGNETRIQGREVGHPLLADNVCVRNELQLGPTGTFLLVTGSNMSGKSTLLRSIGVNVALAQAGAPVCAAEFRLCPLQITTSMRINDSLADGVSFFMAELRRMKEIVDQSRHYQNSTKRTLLYLLDEILQGTNSAERQIAVSRVVGFLMSHGALGAVSTHDLDLATTPDLSSGCQTVHFRETITGEGSQQQMTFDYKMRSGLAPTTNALKLLEFVGLGENKEPAAQTHEVD